MVLENVDPKNERKKHRKEEEKNITMGAFIKLYRENYMCDLKQNTVNNYNSNINVHILPIFKNEKLRDITKGDISKMMIQLSKKSKKIANQVKSVLSSIFTYALKFEYADNNPTKGALFFDVNYTIDRVYSHDEIKTIFKHLHTTPKLFQDAVWTIFLTGKRRTETFLMSADQLDFENNKWTIPPENTKTNQRDVVPITNTLSNILKKRTEHYVFSSHMTNYKEPITSLQYHLEEYRKDKVIDFRFHDIRTTLAVNLSEMGVSFDVIDLILSHKIKGHSVLMNNYMGENKGDYKFEEKKEALEMWEEKLHSIIQ
jgi:integrase